MFDYVRTHTTIAHKHVGPVGHVAPYIHVDYPDPVETKETRLLRLGLRSVVSEVLVFPIADACT